MKETIIVRFWLNGGEEETAYAELPIVHQDDEVVTYGGQVGAEWVTVTIEK